MPLTDLQKAAYCGTTIFYRDFVLTNCELRNFSQDCEYDASGTDLIFHKFQIGVVSHVHDDDSENIGAIPYNVPVGPIDKATTNATQRLNALEAWLTNPRGDFDFWNEGTRIFQAIGSENVPDISTLPQADKHETLVKYDVNNGPKPRHVKVTHIAGMKCYRIEFSIEICLAICDPELVQIDTQYNGGDRPQNGDDAQFNLFVLNNRWSIKETRDRDMYMTRVFSGTLRVRSKTLLPHAFRHLCLPTQLRGFQRQSMQFVQSPDQLTLTYQIVDRQRYAAPPRPAVEWSGTHTENVETFGEQGVATVAMTLKGAVGTPKTQLFNAAIATIQHRIGDLKLKADVEGQTNWIPINMVLVDTLQENQISFSVSVKRIPGSGKKYANLLYEILGKLPAVNATSGAEADPANPDDADRDDENKSQYNRDLWPAPLPYDGSTPAGMFAAYLQSPCVGVHGIPQVDLGTPEGTYPGFDDTETTVPTVQVYESEGSYQAPTEDDDADFQLSDEHAENFAYMHIEMSSEYDINQGRLAMPIAKDPATPTSATIKPIRIHSGTAKRRLWFRASRVGKIPDLPRAADAADENSINEYILSKQVSPSPPRLLANGQQYLYEVEVEIWYAMARVPTDLEKLKTGSMPWDITTIADNVLVYDSHDSNTII